MNDIETINTDTYILTDEELKKINNEVYSDGNKDLANWMIEEYR